MRWQLLTLIITMAFSVPAFAQSEEFEQLLKEGTVFFDATDYDRALDRYQKARAIYDHPRLRIQIGKTYEKLNKCTAANEIYFAIANDKSVESFERDRAKARLAVIDKECSEPNAIPVEVIAPEEIETKPDDTSAELSAPLETKPKKNMLIPVVGGAMTAVGVIGIVIGIVKTSSERSDIDNAWTALASANGCQYNASTDAIFDCPEPGLEQSSAYKNLADEVKSTNTVNTIIFVSSGVVTAAGIGLLIYYFVTPNHKEEGQAKTFSIRPDLGPKYSGVSAEIAF